MLAYIAIVAILAQAYGAPSCPQVKTMAKLDFKRYATGKWFEIGRYAQFSVEKGADCVIYEYNSNVSPAQMSLREVVQKQANFINTTVTPTPDNNAVLFYDLLRKDINVTVQVLDTDYDNYDVLYYCVVDDAKQAISESAWVRSRTPTMKPEIKAIVDKFIANTQPLDTKKFTWDHFTHADCLIDV